jgi:hypothetical protein
VECRVRADAACSARTVSSGYFDHEPGVLAFAAEVWRLDGRAGRPVIAEPLGPDLFEHGPVIWRSRMTIDFRQFVGDVEWRACAESSSG